MSKSAPVTYERFVEVANQLEQDRQRVSVRAIRTQIGGSNSKLMEFLRTWKAQKQLANQVDDDLSDGLRHALLAEFGRVVQSTRERLEAQLADERNSTQEALDALADLEKQLATKEQRIAALEAQYRELELTSEKHIAGLNARLTDAQERETKLQQKIETLQVSQHQAEMDAAVATSRVEALEKQLN